MDKHDGLNAGEWITVIGLLWGIGLTLIGSMITAIVAHTKLHSKVNSHQHRIDNIEETIDDHKLSTQKIDNLVARLDERITSLSYQVSQIAGNVNQLVNNLINKGDSK